jgi:hypothetical protein
MEVSSATRPTPRPTEPPKPVERPRPVEASAERQAQTEQARTQERAQAPKPQPYVNTRGETTGQRVNTTA